MGLEEQQRRQIPWRSAAPCRWVTSSARCWFITATTIPAPTSANAAPPCSRWPTAWPPIGSRCTDCSDRVTPTPSTLGWASTSTAASTPSSPTSRAATAATAFSDRREELQERLRQGPDSQPQPAPAHGAAAPDLPPAAADPGPAQPAPAPAAPAPTHWTLQSIRSAFDWLSDYSISGVWRVLGRLGLKLRSARVQQFSPDPGYQAKLVDLEMALWEARRYPNEVAAVFIDEMGFARWPEPTLDWGPEPAVADRRGANNGLWRLIGALNPLTGQVDYLDNYIVGRAKVIEFYGRLVEAYPRARALYVIQDNW